MATGLVFANEVAYRSVCNTKYSDQTRWWSASV